GRKLMECKTCSGTRFVLVERPKRWYQSGTSAVIGTHKVNEPCEDCDATGLALDPARNPDCTMCRGRGEYGVMDSFGHYDGAEQCQCEHPSLSVTESDTPAHPIEAELLARLEVS